jgi:hypothetical protein
MKKQKHSCLHASYPETTMKVLVCYDGEVVMQTYELSKRQALVSISVKGGTHQIFTENELSVNVLQGRAAVQVKGRKKINYNGSGTFVVPANAWVKITAAPFAQFFARQSTGPVLGDDDEDDCMLR